MAMQVEYVDMEDAPADESVDAADIINGAGEIVVERDEVGEEINQEEEPSEEINPGIVVGYDLRNQGEEPASEEDVDAVNSDLATLRARFNAEHEHEQAIAELKEAHTSAAIERERIEAEFKEAKADEKSALKELTNLIRRGPDYPQPASLTSSDPQAAKIEQAVSNDKQSRSSLSLDDPNADQTWRDIPTSDIIDGIKGMGMKKANAIIELAPTLGDLEELRGQASKVMKPFGSVLPRGVGGGMADEIEERILSRIARHCASIEQAKVDDGGEEPSED